MAEIPVERREGGGIPWWVWALLVALIAALLIWWLSDSGNEGQQTEPAGYEQTQPIATDPATTDPAMTDPAATDPATTTQ